MQNSIIDHALTMSSREIAELTVKQHKHVLAKNAVNPRPAGRVAVTKD